jgi:hypothetical protein
MNAVLARARASQIAKTRLVAKHREDYTFFYREECEKLGLTKHNSTKQERIAKLQSLIEQLQKEGN